jgi:phenylacetate-coenzyme A ligase PaaK-like adenylate-forming protein
VEEAFGVPVGNNWALTEGGGSGQACASLGMHLADDVLIVELVDEQGRPVPPGTRSAKVYLTNLFNHALPLIRYEVTDQIELLADETGCPCGSTHRRIADPFGRLDDVFDYAGTRVHPNVFRGPLARRREIVEYQVRQTPDGAAVTVRTIAEAQGFDPATLAADIAAELARVGVTDPRITVAEVASLPRKTSGKLVRFVPLARP